MRCAIAGIAIAAALAVSGCATHGGEAGGPDGAHPSSITLRLIGRFDLDHRLQFGGTTVGGLSGIDYDPVADLYYLISDDRSAFAPTRFYTARIAIDGQGLHDVALQAVVTLERPDGTPYPPGSADAEAIRYDPLTRDLWWTSEGQRTDATGGTNVRSRSIDPFIRRSHVDGRYVGEVPLDPMFGVSAEARGPRDNRVFEGATLSVDGRSLWVSMEGPLLQDGAMPTMTDGAWARISRYDRDLRPAALDGFGALSAQFAYRIDPIPSSGAWTSYQALNGISEILAFDAARMLVVERALVLGAGWKVRLYEAGWSGATDVRRVASLSDFDTGPDAFVAMTKRLVLDFDTLPIRIDNLEGLCFGPVLGNGHRTLVFVADDNFNPGQNTQFVAFEIVSR